MTDQPDLFGDLPPPSGPRIPKPTETEIDAAIEQTIDDDGICLPREYVRDMLAGRDPTDPAELPEGPRTCGNCVIRCVGKMGTYCDESKATVRETDPGCRKHVYRERSETT